jgi:hypothetical protein
MAATTTALATLQPVWDCRWSQPGHRLTGIADALQPESTWVCVHEGIRRNVRQDECQTCPHFELGSDKIIGAAELGLSIARPSIPPEELGRLLLRLVLFVAAAIFIATGVVVLTGPMAVPFTITLWLCAAAMVGLAVFAEFPGDRG